MTKTPDIGRLSWRYRKKSTHIYNVMVLEPITNYKYNILQNSVRKSILNRQNTDYLNIPLYWCYSKTRTYTECVKPPDVELVILNLE